MLNFPDAPTLNQIFTSGATRWRWDSVKWLVDGAASMAYAPLASPVFTGDPQAPTPATTDNDTSIATTAYVKSQAYATTAEVSTADNLRVLKAGDTVTGNLIVNPGNVGIGGVPDVNMKLHVSTGTTTSVGVQVTSTNATLQFWREPTFTVGAAAIGLNQPGVGLTNDMVFSSFVPASGWFERMRITQAGNVGIGTTAPSSKLTLAGVSSPATDALGGAGIFHISTGTGVTTDESLFMGVHDGDYSWIQAVKAGVATRTLALNPNGGNVGIGTSAPVGKLTVSTNTGISQPSGSQLLISGSDSGSSSATIDAYSGATTSTSAFFMRTAKGTSAAPTALQLNDRLGTILGMGWVGPAGYSTGAIIAFRAVENFTPASNGTEIEFATTAIGSNTPVERMRIADSGNVGIGTTAPGSLLTVNGACANVSGAWTTISDASVKQDVQPYTRGLDAIVALNPVQFRYRAGAPLGIDTDEDGEPVKGPSRQLFGLIADDVAAIVPEIVGSITAKVGDKESVELSTLEPGNLVYAVINSLKEVAARLDHLESKTVP